MGMIEAATKAAKEKAQNTWTLTKKIVGTMMVWGLIFSIVTIGKLKVAFDYDDTLVFSTPAYTRAFASGVPPFTPAFWEIVNNSYELDSRKPVPYALAWIFRIFGFKVTILTPRPGVGGAALKKEWRYLATSFIFTDGSEKKHRFLEDGNYVLYFGDSDSDIAEGRKARVPTLRVKRSPKSSYKEDYNPGGQSELVVPLSDY
jgi:acid phosphatase class B